MEKFRRIVVCTDFSETGDRAVAKAFALASDEDCMIYLLHAVEPPPTLNPLYAHYYSVPSYSPSVLKQIVETSQKKLQSLIPDHIQNTGIKVEIQVPLGEPVAEILQVAKEWPADILVVGTHGRRGISRALLGSVAEKLVRLAECPVLVVH